MALAVAFAVAAPAASAIAAGTESSESETREVVDLHLSIATDGRAIGKIAQLVELDTETSLALSADGHDHAVAITVRKADERGRKLAVTIGYERDGKAVLETTTIEAAAKKAKIVRNGDVALSLKLAPKTVSTDELPSKKSREKVDFVEDTNDPLAGL